MMGELSIEQTAHSKPVLVKLKIQELIDQGVYPPGSRLPAETRFSEMLGVSRTTLREVLHLLEEDGILLRRQGVGTYVRKTHSFVLSPLDVSAPPSVIIRSAGANPGTQSIAIVESKANATVAQKLNLEPGYMILQMETVRTADSRPVLYSVDMFPQSILGGEQLSGVFEESTANRIEEICDKMVTYGECKVLPVLADEKLCHKLQVDLSSPLLLIDTIEYDEDENPLLYCLDYWVSDFIDFRIARRAYRENRSNKAT